MKKGILNIGLLLTMSLAVVNLTSCNNDEPDRPGTTVTEIRATNITGDTSGITTVGIRWWSMNGRDYETIAQAPFVNNGFTINLPATLDDRFLHLLRDEISEKITVSDENAKMFAMLESGILAFDEDGEEMGAFFFGHEDNDNFHQVVWFYADRNVSITGREEEEFCDFWGCFTTNVEYNLNFRRGWNIAYLVVDQDEKMLLTTRRPTGVEFSWYFESWGDWDDWDFDSLTTRTKSLRSINSLFAK